MITESTYEKYLKRIGELMTVALSESESIEFDKMVDAVEEYENHHYKL